MRILLVYWDLGVGGVQHMTVKMANELTRRGHDVTLVVAFRQPEAEPYVLDPHVKIVDFGTQRARKYFWQLTLYLAREHDIDVIFSATTVPNIITSFARLLSGNRAKLTVSERDNPVLGFAACKNKLSRLIWSFKPIAYKMADEIVCVSNPLATSLSNFASIRRNRITVIHNPAYPEGDYSSSPAPHIWLTDPSVPIIITAGRLTLQKDFATLILAFANVITTRTTRLILLGDGEERSRLEAQVKDLGLTNSILFAGTQSDIMPWLVHSRVFVMSSIFEGFGNVLVQALAAGCLVVSTDCPDGPAEILDNGKYGALVPPSDHTAMAEAILKALSTAPQPKIQLTRAMTFSLPRILDQYEALFFRNYGKTKHNIYGLGG